MSGAPIYYVAVANHDGCPPIEDSEYEDPQADKYTGDDPLQRPLRARLYERRSFDDSIPF